MPKKQKLSDLAKTIRSKNAGVDKVTFDIIFKDKDVYEHVKQTGIITKASIAQLYGISEDRISDFVLFDPANAIKFTFYRQEPSGSPGDPDIFGAQQYAPLLSIEIPAK